MGAISDNIRDETAAARSDPPFDFVATGFGDRLRRLMLREHLSLDKLADFSGLSRNSLAKIINGETLPTISLLWKIANVFGVPFGSLTSSHERRGSFVLRQSQKSSLLSTDNRFTSRALFPYSRSRLVEFYELTIAAEYAQISEAHAPGTIESLIVVHGEVEITAGREAPQILRKGDAIVFEADVPHSYANHGQTPAILHLVMSYANLIDAEQPF
jgi:transcriptional regulator with XRE-family HTH domain